LRFMYHSQFIQQANEQGVFAGIRTAVLDTVKLGDYLPGKHDAGQAIVCSWSGIPPPGPSSPNHNGIGRQAFLLQVGQVIKRCVGNLRHRFVGEKALMRRDQYVWGVRQGIQIGIRH
jgi:hypothetical protein